MLRVSGGSDGNRDKGGEGRGREGVDAWRCLAMLGLQGASSTARGKSTQCPSSSQTRHSVEKRKRERGVLVFPASISIRSQPLQSYQRGGNHTSCSSSVFAWFWPCRRETDVPTKAPALKLDTENWAKGLLIPSTLKRSAETRAGAPCFAAFGAPWSSRAGWRWRCYWRRLHWWEWHSIVTRGRFTAGHTRSQHAQRSHSGLCSWMLAVIFMRECEL